MAARICSGRARTRVDSVRFLHRTIPDGSIKNSAGRETSSPSGSAALMDEVVGANRLGIHVGEKGECVALLPTVRAIGRGRIDADGEQPNPPCIEVVQMVLETPQLGVAQRSPITSVKDEHHPVEPIRPVLARSQDRRKSNQVAVFVLQGEIRSFLSTRPRTPSGSDRLLSSTG